MQAEANAQSASWLGELENANETDATDFVGVSNVVSLSITFDVPPGGVSGMLANPGFYPSNGALYTSSLAPTLESQATSPFGAQLAYEFEVELGSTLVESGASAFVASGSVGSWALPDPLADATTYTVYVRAYDGTLYGPWSSAFSITPNVVTPPAPSVSCPDYPVNKGSALVPGGAACTFADTQTTINGYVYQLQESGGSPVSGFSTTGNATIDPTSAGQYTLTVYAQNDAGTDSPTTTYDFTVEGSSSITLTGLGVWPTADPATGAPMECVLWQFTGAAPTSVSGQIHFELLSTAAGSQPQPASDWTITYTAAGSYTGTSGEYSWCSDTDLLPTSPAGAEWTAVSLTGQDGEGDTLTLGWSALSGMTITDPEGTSDPDTFTVAG